MNHETSTSETIVALYLALKLRDSCEGCNGSGVKWVAIDDGTEVDAEPCECTQIAWYVLEYHKQEFEDNLSVFFAEQDIVPTDEDTQFDALVDIVLGHAR